MPAAQLNINRRSNKRMPTELYASLNRRYRIVEGRSPSPGKFTGRPRKSTTSSGSGEIWADTPRAPERRWPQGGPASPMWRPKSMGGESSMGSTCSPRECMECARSQREVELLEERLATVTAGKATAERQARESAERARVAQREAEQLLQQMGEKVSVLEAQHRTCTEEFSVKLKEEMAARQAMESELQGLRRQREESEEARASANSGAAGACSEGRLRAALTQRHVTTEELKAAIQAVEQLVGEARREFAARQLRERRAAMEQLYALMGSGDEGALADAISEARRADVDEEDVAKGEAVLRELQSLTEEQRAAKAAKEQEAKNKERAFLLVKRDDAAALRELVASLDEAGIAWQGWKDHARRTLLQAAQALRSTKVQNYLGPLLKPPAKEKQFVPLVSVSAQVDRQPLAGKEPKPESQKNSAQVTDRPGEPGQVPSQATMPVGSSAPMEDIPHSPTKRRIMPELTPEAPSPMVKKVPVEAFPGEAELRLKAFRAVVKDDTAALAEVIVDRVPMEVWGAWVNKGGKDLLTLSEERGSSAAYSMLAKALGLLKERKRESFEEREAVWVLFGGDVQPRRASVLEDTAAEADEILLEFWDGNEAPTRVNRDFVLKSV